MKKDEALKYLLEYLTNDKFIVPSQFVDDLKELLNKKLKGQETLFFNLLIKQLSYILELSAYNVSKANSNEILRYCLEFECYSLHISSKSFNIRLLGTYLKEKFVFLLAFYEIAGKKQTNYSKQITIAKKRLEKIKEEIEYE